VKANFDISGGKRPLSPDIESTLLRICQESLANVKKHARASKVDVNLTFEELVVKLSIRDNGIGFDTEAPTEGAFGLISMRDRARSAQVYGKRHRQQANRRRAFYQ
jgi:signal transduction histidine kinase